MSQRVRVVLAPFVLADDREDVAFSDDQVFDAVFRILGTCVLRVDDVLPNLDGHVNDLAFVGSSAWSGCDDRTLLGLFFRSVGNDDSAR